MKKKELTDLQQMVALWKEKGIERGEFEFNCGGDQMNDTDLKFFNKKDEEIECGELNDYFDGEIYNRVEFYVNSDGHYQGEFGMVEIELEDDDDDDEQGFIYTKHSKSEWNESHNDTQFCELTKEEFELFKASVHSVIGGADGKDLNYKRDCILNDEQIDVLTDMREKINDFVSDFEFKIEDVDAEPNDWWNYTTDLQESDYEEDGYEFDSNNPSLLKKIDGKYFVAVYISKSYTFYKEEENLMS